MTTQRSFTTPVGRIVGGDVFRGNTKDYEGRPLKDKEGNLRSEYVLIVAFLKTDPGTTAVIQEIEAAAAEGFPSMFANGAKPAPGAFSYKVVDGDSAVPNSRGTVPNTVEGYPGNFVVRFKNGFCPEAFDAQNIPIVDEKMIKRGYYVRVYAQTRGNESVGNPGVYVNHSLVQLVGYGEEIASGPDAATAFGAAPAVLPAGASVTPLAPTGPMPGAHAPAGGTAPAPAPGVAPVPSPGFGAVPPAPPAPAAPPPPAAGPQMTAGCPYTYEALKAQGWTDDAMRTAGHLV